VYRSEYEKKNQKGTLEEELKVRIRIRGRRVHKERTALKQG
jgi:hypothetical protein